ncbi:hypothetical protein [Paraburkholderia lacunae]|uniref:hypothetical protein n=1 Tax=Paraburkholderia lacunae TaxID=2211104 RepID=UPI00105880F9|nr:hypothetical protein [Paraburkholderia lacunae]
MSVLLEAARAVFDNVVHDPARFPIRCQRRPRGDGTVVERSQQKMPAAHCKLRHAPSFGMYLTTQLRAVSQYYGTIYIPFATSGSMSTHSPINAERTHLIGDNRNESRLQAGRHRSEDSFATLNEKAESSPPSLPTHWFWRRVH